VLGRRRSRRQADVVPLAVQLKADETVVFSWLVRPSKAARHAGMANVNPMPFDGKRLIYGGFKVLVER
jgi:uncharacterized protein YbaA (DUF1428 family)